MKAAPSRRQLVQALLPFSKRSTGKGLSLVLLELSLYVLSMAIAAWGHSPWLRTLGAVFAGLKISALITLGHDAVHQSLVKGRALNRIVAQLCFLPALINSRLWELDHNLNHHRGTNGPQPDAYRPLSLEEYRARSWMGRGWERLVRGPNVVGFGMHHLVERWCPTMVVPRGAWISTSDARRAWPQSVLVMAYFVALLGLAASSENGLRLQSVVFVVLTPLFVFLTLYGFSGYFNHTHPKVPWFESNDARFEMYGQERVSVHVAFPGWFQRLTHNVMEHGAHHVLPTIPCYRLRAAQKELGRLLGEHAVVLPGTPKALVQTLNTCKLYDYSRHCWLDFSGNVTSQVLDDGSVAIAEDGRSEAGGIAEVQKARL